MRGGASRGAAYNEIRVDFLAAAYPGSSSTVFAEHEMPDLALHLWAGVPKFGPKPGAYARNLVS